MHFAHDTEVALVDASAWVNTLRGADEHLGDRTALDAFLVDHPYSGVHLGTNQELVDLRTLRSTLRSVWDVACDRDAAVEIVNAMLSECDAQPYLARHDAYDWHLHVTRPDAPLAQRIAAEVAMAFLDLIRTDELDRLRFCAAADCEDVLVDLSRNRSKRFCATGNCGNRTHVAAYRARRSNQS